MSVVALWGWEGSRDEGVEEFQVVKKTHHIGVSMMRCHLVFQSDSM